MNKLPRNLFAICWIVSATVGNPDIPKTEGILFTAEEKSYVFISDDIFQGIIPTLNECWNTLLTALGQGKLGEAEYEKQDFWNDILLKRLKPYHESIRDIDKVILANRPSTVLNNAVNVTNLKDAFHLSDQIGRNKNTEWIKMVKDGWIKVAGMMVQLHFKYDWSFDHLYSEGRTSHVKDNLFSLNETLKQYFTWFNVKDLEIPPQQDSSDDLVMTSKQAAAGNFFPRKERNLFLGLKELLRLEAKRLARLLDQQPNSNSICSGNETIAGKRGRIFRYIPVYVLLHLLNGEFKYYIMRNVADMFRCVQTKKCDSKISVASEDHLRKFYNFYFDGIVQTFKEKSKEISPLPSTIPRAAWRWKCDPIRSKLPTEPQVDGSEVPKKHIEDVTFARFYDYQTLFVAEEKEISLTKTCRESCDMFDGGYSSVPCEEDDWECLAEDKDFDCLELRRQGIPCPGKARALCPYGIKCTTSKMKNVKICNGQRDWRHIEWLDRGDGKVMGKKTPCSATGMKNISSKLEAERSGITKFEPENCEICLCKCYEPLSNRTHRYISLQPQIADIQNQRAVVGIKFTKIGGVIYPKIAQASVKYGMPIASTVEWIEPNPVQNLSDASTVFRLGRNSKNILLDDLLAPIGFAITGVRFVVANYSIKGDYELDSASNVHVIFPVYGSVGEDQSWSFKSFEKELALEVQMTALSELGELKPETVTWKSNSQNTSLFRGKPVVLDDAEDPTLAEVSSVTNSTTNQFISIQGTSIKKDLGQTPVPFFDTQELIEPNNMTLLRGLGIFYKTQPGFGGFLSFRIISLPISDAPQNPRYDLWHSRRLTS